MEMDCTVEMRPPMHLARHVTDGTDIYWKNSENSWVWGRGRIDVFPAAFEDMKQYVFVKECKKYCGTRQGCKSRVEFRCVKRLMKPLGITQAKRYHDAKVNDRKLAMHILMQELRDGYILEPRIDYDFMTWEEWWDQYRDFSLFCVESDPQLLPTKEVFGEWVELRKKENEYLEYKVKEVENTQ